MSNIDNVVGIVGATIGIGQYIVNDYVITIAATEGDYGYTITITRGTETQTVTLYGLTSEQYDAMLGYLEAAQTAAQSSASSANTAATARNAAQSARDDAQSASETSIQAANAAITARNSALTYANNAQTAANTANSARSGAEAARSAAVSAKTAAESAATRAETAAGQITGMTAEAETLTPGSPATASFLDGVLSLGIPAGATGATGADGNGIVSIIKTGTQGNVDTYTITMTDGSTSTFTVTNGTDGAVLSVAGKTGAVTLDAGDVEYDDTDTYAAGSVGAGLADLKSQISVIEAGSSKYTTQNGGLTGTGLIDNNNKRVRTDFIPVIEGGVLSVTLPTGTTGIEISLSFYEDNKSDTTRMFSSPFATEVSDLRIPAKTKFVRVLLKSNPEAEITRDVVPYVNIATTTLVHEVHDVINLGTFSVVSEWEKGTTSAVGSISSTGNGTVSSLIDASGDFIAYIGFGCRATIGVYNNGVYIGKVNSSGQIDKVAGSWTYYTDLFNTKSIREYAIFDTVKISLVPTDGTTLTNNTYLNWAIQKVSIKRLTISNLSKDVENIKAILPWNDANDYFRKQFTANVGHNGDGTYIYSTNRNSIMSPLCLDADVTIEIPTGYKLAYQYFDGYEVGSTHLLSASSWIENKSIVIPSGTYFCLNVAFSDNSDTDANTQNALVFYMQLTADQVYGMLYNKNNASYYIDSGMRKKYIHPKRIGTLTYIQSFCKYNGHYYSTNGSKISEQDEHFISVNDVTIAVGHGNAMHTGLEYPNYAYISGWDDQKIYVVDLTTITLVRTIDLPTTGYTTCAVDDFNGIAYIFQRDSYPDTLRVYNLIAYDYVNGNVLSTKKITRKLAGMQAVDFVDGKIYALFGFGTSAGPNYYIVFNTNGDIIGEYVIKELETKEPEGVCIDRDNKSVLISRYSRDVFLLEDI